MYIGVDLGSTNIKAAIYDQDMKLVDRRSVPVSYIRENGFVEFDAESYCSDLMTLIGVMVKENFLTILHRLECKLSHICDSLITERILIQ